MNNGSEVLQKEFRIARIIWVAILVALLIYAVVGHVLFDHEFMDTDTVPVELIRNILFGIGGLLLIVSFIVRKRMLAAGGAGQPLGEAEAAAKYRMAVMIAAGLCEVVGLFGLVLVFLGDSRQTFFLFLVAAAVALIFHRPKMEELQQLAGRSGLSM